jgi:hypothetical protein
VSWHEQNGTALSASGVIDDDFSLYKNRYRQHGGKQISCFYAAPKGANPIAKGKPWFNNIDYAEDLLKTKATRNNTMDLHVKLPGTSEEKTMNTHKRKNPQSQIEGFIIGTFPY